MAGTDPRFPAAKFRDAIHFVMNMAKPGLTTEQLTFSWEIDRTYARQDSSHEPFNWTSTALTTDAPASVVVPAAYEFQYSVRSGTAANEVGDFDSPVLVITVLDVDYPRLFSGGRRADTVEIPNKGSFRIRFEAPPEALFDVTIHTLYAAGLDLA